MRIMLAFAVALALAASPAAAQFTRPITNAAGAITTGGTFQVLAQPGASRASLEFQNRSGNGDVCYLFFGAGSATTGAAIKLTDGADYLRAAGVIPSDEVQATCTTTGDAFYFATQ